MDTYTLEQASPSSVSRGDGKPRRRLRTVEEKTKIVQETLAPVEQQVRVQAVSTCDLCDRDAWRQRLLHDLRLLLNGAQSPARFTVPAMLA